MERPDGRVIGDIVVVIVGLLIGIGIAQANIPGLLDSAADDGTQPPANDTATPSEPTGPAFAYAGQAYNHLWLWGIETENVAFPPDMRLQRTTSITETSQLLASGDVEVALLLPSLLPQVRQYNQQAVVLPYYLRSPDDFFTIYVREDSTITSPSDLAGKTLAMPKTSPITPLTLEVLAEEHGVRTEDMTLITDTSQALSLLLQGRADAALALGSPDGDIRPVMHPLRAISQRYDVPAGIHGVVVVKNETYIETGRDVVSALNRSALRGSQNIDSVISHYQTRQALLPINLTRTLREMSTINGTYVSPMSEQYRRMLQSMYTRGFNEGFYPQQVNVTQVLPQ